MVVVQYYDAQYDPNKNNQIITVQIECNDLQAILKCLCKQ